MKIINNNWFILGVSVILALSNISFFKAQSISSTILVITEFTLKTVIFFLVVKLMMFIALKLTS
ncbi:hypothetical protein [Mammaliicoccus sp. Dog046]|uniref:hypothetical protein n=1 Tax=Mammaliicoccus sp. Dog046 TaxID=3034233 RepID=UPI002B2636EF|nr:hypothetical protein [Mammaliicoccus sp. Dog046]WQK86237.1 hypothetical protein P3U32_04140 [Mammaliicoccus sp. Dog046]